MGPIGRLLEHGESCHISRGAGQSSRYVFSDVASVAGDSVDVVRSDGVLEPETDEVQARRRRHDTTQVDRAPVCVKRVCGDCGSMKP